MPRAAAYGLAFLAFAAGFVLAGTLAFTYRSTDAAEPEIGACSPEMDRAYEIIRFARESHVPWFELALRGQGSADFEGSDTADPWFQRWWIDHYAEVLATLETLCVPDSAYPNLTELPGTWETYPPRRSAGDAE
jgi:hypothetical protein